jgi:DNA-directed RNA polymerase specialized sigma24 family protein
VLATPTEEARAALFGDVRAMLCRAARSARVDDADANDVAQVKTPRVVAELLAGKAEGKEEGYVWSAGVRAALSLHRARSARKRGDGKLARESEIEIEIDEPDDPESLLDGRQGDAATQALLDRIKEILNEPETPPSYRDILVAIHFTDPPVTINELAAKDLAEHPVNRQGVARTAKQARAAVDQKLKNARKWLRDRLVGAFDVGAIEAAEPHAAGGDA